MALAAVRHPPSGKCPSRRCMREPVGDSQAIGCLRIRSFGCPRAKCAPSAGSGRLRRACAIRRNHRRAPRHHPLSPTVIRSAIRSLRDWLPLAARRHRYKDLSQGSGLEGGPGVAKISLPQGPPALSFAPLASACIRLHPLASAAPVATWPGARITLVCQRGPGPAGEPSLPAVLLHDRRPGVA